VQSPSEDTRPGYVWFDALEDCNLTISFSDDTPLLFSMDIDLYQSTTPALVYEFEYFDTEQSSHIHIQLIGASRIRSVTLVLEAGRSFDIVATRCANLNTTITYSNNSLLGGGQFHYEAEGSIHFTLGEDVDTSEGGLAVLIGSRPDPYNAALRPNMTYIDIALPDDMDGEVTFYQTDVDILENVGWPFQNLSTYGTDPFDTEALLKIDLYSKFAIAWLLA